MRILTAFIMLLLIGCASDPEVRTVTQTVKVPVTQSCIDSGDVPPQRNLRTDNINRNDDIFIKVQAMTVDMLTLKKDDGELRALVSGCLKNSEADNADQ